MYCDGTHRAIQSMRGGHGEIVCARLFVSERKGRVGPGWEGDERQTRGKYSQNTHFRSSDELNANASLHSYFRLPSAFF